MDKEFIDASTARLALVKQSGLGSFELRQNANQTTQYTFLLYLDVYQSNSPRAWLEYRWRFRSLLGAQVMLAEKRSLLVLISREFGSDQLALEGFNGWVADLNGEFQACLADRR
jgi:hypothetical protein